MEEDMVQNLQHEAGLGKSDHVTLLFDTLCYSSHHHSLVERPNYFKGNPAEFIRSLEDVDWSTADKHSKEKYRFLCESVLKLSSLVS